MIVTSDSRHQNQENYQEKRGPFHNDKGSTQQENTALNNRASKYMKTGYQN